MSGMWGALGLHLLLTVGLAVITFIVRSAHAKNSAKDWFVGWVIFATSVGGFLAAGVVQWLLFPVGRTFRGMFTAASWGWVFGLVSGAVIGSWVWGLYRKDIEGNEDTE